MQKSQTSKTALLWISFSEEEFISSITKYNNSSTPGPDKLSWRHLKSIIKNKVCLKEIINIANTCFELGHWSSYFKTSVTIVIPKSNKESYDSPKSFRPIILLNTLGKLIEKVIGECFQFHVISSNFIHQSQLGKLKYRSTSDTGIVLIHFIYMGWIINVMTNTLAFDIVQFFPSLSYYLLSYILGKAGFDSKIEYFFSNYLIGRKTWYYWNNFSLSFFNINIGVGQGSALSVLFALYLAPILYILENCLKFLKIPVSILSFVDDGLFIARSKSISILNSLLFYSYNITSIFLKKFSLIMKHTKIEVFHFSRSNGILDPPLLNLSILGGPILHPRETWKYLGFIFDRKLSFCQHVDFYINKAISMVKCMKILKNFICSLIPHQKQLFYRSCVLLIALYSFQLQFYNKAPLSYPLKILGKIYRKVALWILRAF